MSCDKLARTLPGYRPQWTVRQGVAQLVEAFRAAGLSPADFTGPRYVRLRRIRELQQQGRLDATLRWAGSRRWPTRGGTMKVVLFCGGLGMRLRDYADNVPKPMVPIGYRPIIWHLMKYYAHFGHKDFILCLGYRGDLIKHYFLNYEEFVTNDFVLSEGGRRRELLSSDIEDWRITFVDTGLARTIGERLRRCGSTWRARSSSWPTTPTA